MSPRNGVIVQIVVLLNPKKVDYFLSLDSFELIKCLVVTCGILQN
jgi:hypothetical protein